MSSASRYGVLISVRKRVKDVHNLLNAIVSKFGKSIEWHKRTGYHNIKPIEGRELIYFRFRGNQYVRKLELLSYNLKLLRSIRKEFPNCFKMDVEIKEYGDVGWLY